MSTLSINEGEPNDFLQGDASSSIETGSSAVNGDNVREVAGREVDQVFALAEHDYGLSWRAFDPTAKSKAEAREKTVSEAESRKPNLNNVAQLIRVLLSRALGGSRFGHMARAS